jgi:hypothetical protein
MRASALALVGASLAVAELAAQQQTSDVIPRELAVALLDRYGMSHKPIDIVVGRLPRSFPTDALPRDGITILGGVEADGAATVVAEASERAEGAVARVVAQLGQAGWRPAEEEGRTGGGFVPSVMDRPRVFCRANTVLVYTARDRQGATGSRLHLTASHPVGYSQCTRDADPARGRPPRFDSPLLPSLEAPPGARMLGSGQGSAGPGSREAHTRLETSQSASAVAAHYADLLRRAGWTVSAPAQAERVVVYGTQRLDDDKRQLTGALIVLGVADTQQLDVILRVVRGELPR